MRLPPVALALTLAAAAPPAAFAQAGTAAPAPSPSAAAARDDDDDDDDDESPAGVAAAGESGATSKAAEATATVEPAKVEPASVEPAGDDDDDDDGDGGGGKSSLLLEWSGRVQSDLRFRTHDVKVGHFYDGRELPAGVDRNENLLGVRLAAAFGEVTGRADVDFVLYGFSRELDAFSELSRRENLDPFRIDVHNLYVEMRDLGINGLDLRVGQQLVEWGVADNFNPTNNLNADDLEDVLLLGEQQGNMMVRLDYWLDEDWSHQLVLVPVFKPALLPRSAELATGQVDRLPMVDESLRWRFHAETAAALDNPLDSRNATVVTSVRPILPDVSFENMQLGYRLAGTVLDQDVSLSYYLGRSDFPVAARQDVHQVKGRRCNPADANDCIDSLLATDVTLAYPRMHVFGLNLAGELGALKAISEKYFKALGYRLEAAVVVPRVARMEIHRGPISLGPIDVPPGEYDYDGDNQAGGPRPVVVSDTPFAKWTLGLDYTFSEHAYANLQWVHGLADEFGAGDFLSDGVTVAEGGVSTDPTTTALECAFKLSGETCARELLRPRLGDYLVASLRFTLLQQKLMLQLASVLALNGVTESTFDPAAKKRINVEHSAFSEKGFSAALSPEVNYNFGNGLDLGGGALAQLGKSHTKFGDPAAGGSIVWARSRFNF